MESAHDVQQRAEEHRSSAEEYGLHEMASKPSSPSSMAAGIVLTASFQGDYFDDVCRQRNSSSTASSSSRGNYSANAYSFLEEHLQHLSRVRFLPSTHHCHWTSSIGLKGACSRSGSSSSLTRRRRAVVDCPGDWPSSSHGGGVGFSPARDTVRKTFSPRRRNAVVTAGLISLLLTLLLSNESGGGNSFSSGGEILFAKSDFSSFLSSPVIVGAFADENSAVVSSETSSNGWTDRAYGLIAAEVERMLASNVYIHKLLDETSIQDNYGKAHYQRTIFSTHTPPVLRG